MKNQYISILAILLFTVGNLHAEGFLRNTHDKDTIEVHFGNSGKILIKVESKEDLDALKEYDINSILQDIKVPTREELKNSEKIIMQDDDAKKYLKDSIEEKEFYQSQSEFNSDKQANETAHNCESSSNHNEERRRFSGRQTSFIALLDWGINNFLENGNYPDVNDQPYTVKPWGSWYIGIMPTWQTHVAGKLAINYGAGVSWFNFKFQDVSTRLVKGDNEVIFDHWDSSLNPSKSKLTVAHLNVHFVPVLDFGYRTKKKTYADGFVQKTTSRRNDGFRIGVGAFAGSRIDSYQKLVYKPSGDKSKLHERDNYFINNFRYGARFIAGMGEVDIFVNYDISTVFSKNRGPELNAFTFGLSF